METIKLSLHKFWKKIAAFVIVFTLLLAIIFGAVPTLFPPTPSTGSSTSEVFFTSMAADGYIRNATASSGWGAIFGCPNGEVLNTAATLSGGRRVVSTAAYMFRSFIFFNLSTFPYGATILNVTLLPFFTTISAVNAFNLTVYTPEVGSEYPNTTLTYDQYDYLKYDTAPEVGRLASSSITASNFCNITLTTSSVNLTGLTKYILRTDLETANSTWTGPSNEYWSCSSNEGSYAPRLYITYVTGSTDNFGYETQGTVYQATLENQITGTTFTCPFSGTAQSITAYITTDATYFGYVKAAIYYSNYTLVAGSDAIEHGSGEVGWYTFNISSLPSVTINVQYILVAWSESKSGTCTIAGNAGATNESGYQALTYGTFPDPLVPTNISRKYSIYCTVYGILDLKLIYAGNPALGIYQNYVSNARLPYTFISIKSLQTRGNCTVNWKNQSGWCDIPMTYVMPYHFINITGLTSGFDYTFNLTASDGDNRAYYNWTKTGLMGQTVQRTFQVGTPQSINYTIYYMAYEAYNQTWSTEGHHHDQGTDGSTTDTGISRSTGHDEMEVTCTLFCGYWIDETYCFSDTFLSNMYIHTWWSDMTNGTSQNATLWYGLYNPNSTFNLGSWNSYGTTTISNNTSRDNYTYYDGTFEEGRICMKDVHFINTTSLNITLNANNFYRMAVVVRSDYWAGGGSPEIRNNATYPYSFVILNLPSNATLATLDTDGDGTNDYDELFVNFTDPIQGYGPTTLNYEWNTIGASVIAREVGHSLGEINASLNYDSINWTVITVDYLNGTQWSMLYNTSYNADCMVVAGSEVWIYCLDVTATWTHTYE